MNIRCATQKDIPFLLQLTKACAQAMITQNIFQWNEEYPSKQAFKTDVSRKELYALEVNKTIVMFNAEKCRKRETLVFKIEF